MAGTVKLSLAPSSGSYGMGAPRSRGSSVARACWSVRRTATESCARDRDRASARCHVMLMPPTDDAKNGTKVLEQAYEDVIGERDRLRDARAGFTSRLGPLPASAAIVIGLTGTAADKVSTGWILGAAFLLALLMLISGFYSGLPPYRVLRARRQKEVEAKGRIGNPEHDKLGFGLEASNPEIWLRKKIELEEQVCGPLTRDQPVSLSREVGNLQDALNVERWALVVVQVLFAEIIFVLVTGFIVRGSEPSTQREVGAVFAIATLVGLGYAWHRWGLFKGWRSQSPVKTGENSA